MKKAGNQMDAQAIESAAGVLLTCIGRRVSLLDAFRRAARRLRRPVQFYGTDVHPLSPALQSCDEGFLVKATSHPRYIGQLLSIVRRHRIKLLIPTVDLDLRLLAENRPRFAELGCRVLVSDPEVIDICQDKRKTCEFLQRERFGCPTTYSVREALAADSRGQLNWPCFVKPWDGHAGKGATIVRDREELRFYAQRISNAICQEFAQGTEYTCDVYIDFEGNVRCVTPRRRLEVRSGEVSKAQIVKNLRIMNEVAKLVRNLGAGPGVVTVQLFLTGKKQFKFIEINPRFGGGAPLSIRAGADFPRWILQELAGRRPRIGFDAFEDQLVMLRYDAEVWVDPSDMKGVKI